MNLIKENEKPSNLASVLEKAFKNSDISELIEREFASHKYSDSKKQIVDILVDFRNSSQHAFDLKRTRFLIWKLILFRLNMELQNVQSLCSEDVYSVEDLREAFSSNLENWDEYEDEWEEILSGIEDNEFLWDLEGKVDHNEYVDLLLKSFDIIFGTDNFIIKLLEKVKETQ